MNIIKKWAAQVSDAISREAFLRGIFSVFNSQVVNPVALAINGAGAFIAKHGGAAAAFVLVNGALVKIAAGQAMPALTGISIPTGSKQIVGFTTDAQGNLYAISGNVATAIGSLTFPPLPDNQVALGYLIVENATGSTFTGGTTALDTASLTVTYVNQYDGIAPLSIV